MCVFPSGVSSLELTFETLVGVGLQVNMDAMFEVLLYAPYVYQEVVCISYLSAYHIMYSFMLRLLIRGTCRYR